MWICGKANLHSLGANLGAPNLSIAKEESLICAKALKYWSVLSGKGMTYRGETGAQSAIVPALDGVLGIEHERDELREYLMEMREYMPPKHVAFIEAVEAGPSVREFV